MRLANLSVSLGIFLITITSGFALVVPAYSETSKNLEKECNATGLGPAEIRLRRWIAEQRSFPKKYELSQLMDSEWKSCAELTIRQDGDYTLVLSDGRNGNQLRSLTPQEATQLWGRPWMHFTQPTSYETYCLIALVNGEPSIFNIDLEFSKTEGPALNPGGFAFKPLTADAQRKCLTFRVRGPGITNNSHKTTQE